MLSGAYAWKLAASGETYEVNAGSRRLDLIVGIIATLYGAWLVYAAGLQYLLMCAILFAPGILVYWKARSERGATAFKAFEGVLAVLLLAAALLAAYLIWNGTISPL